MKTNRLFIRLNSAVAILAAMFYLSAIAMAADDHKERKTGKTPPPQQDTFGDDGTPTFEDTPTPTFQPRPLIPAKHDKEKEPKEKKEKKDKGGDEVEIQATGPDLTILEIKVAPDNGTFGDSLVPNQGGTIQVILKNKGNADAIGDVRLDTWRHRPGTVFTPPLNPDDFADFVELLGSLTSGASITRTYSVTSFASVSGLYIPRAMVDRFNTIAETNELNNILTGSYPVVVMGGVTPLGTLFAVGIPGSITFKFTTNPANVNWPPGFPTTNAAALVLGSITASGVKKGEATYTYSHASGTTGIDILTGTCAASSRSGSVTIVGVDLSALRGIVVGVGESATIRFLTDPPNTQWPKGWPQRSLNVSVPNLATITSMQTNIGFVDYVVKANATLTGIASLFNHCGTSSNFATLTILNGTLSTARFLNSVSLSFLQNNGTAIGNVPTLHWAVGSLANNQNSFALGQVAPVAYVRNNPLVLEISVRLPADLTNILSITVQGTTAWTYGSDPITASPFGTFASVSATVSGGFATLQLTSSGSYSVVDVHSVTSHFVITRAFTADGSHAVSINAGSFTTRVYNLLDAPTGTWAVAGGPRPLVELLEIACRMARGAAGSTTVATSLVNRIHTSEWVGFSDSVLFFRPRGTFVYNPITVRTIGTSGSQTYDLAQYLRSLDAVASAQQCNDVANFLALHAQALGVNAQPLFILAGSGTSLTTAGVFAAGTHVERLYVNFNFHQIVSLGGFVYDASVGQSSAHNPFSGETLGGYVTKAFPGATVTTQQVATLSIGNVAATNTGAFVVERVLSGTLSVSGFPGSSGTVTVEVFNPDSINAAYLTPRLDPFGASLSNPVVTVLGTATTGPNRGTVSVRFDVGGATVTPGSLQLIITTPGTPDGDAILLRITEP